MTTRPPDLTPQRSTDLANTHSIARRQARAHLRRQLRNGTTTLHHVLANPTPDTEGLLVYELVKHLPMVGRQTLAAVGRTAAVDRVNLFVPVGRCSERTREWLVEHLPTPAGESIITTACLGCGSLLPESTSPKPRKWCSDLCRKGYGTADPPTASRNRLRLAAVTHSEEQEAA